MTCPIIRPGVTLYLGQTYTGKTTLMRAELERLPAPVRALIFDPSGSAALDSFLSLESLEACRRFLCGRLSTGAWVRVVRLSDPDEYGRLASTAKVWRGVLWIIDDGSSLMEVKAVSRMASRVAIAGRHMGHKAGVELWFIGHRPIDAPKNVRGAVARVYTFRQKDPDDMRLLGKWCGVEFGERAASLRDREYLQWPDGDGAGVTCAPRVATLQVHGTRRTNRSRK